MGNNYNEADHPRGEGGRYTDKNEAQTPDTLPELSATEYSLQQVHDAMDSINYNPYKPTSPADLQRLTAIVEHLDEHQRQAVAAMNEFDDYDADEEANIMMQADDIPFNEFDDRYLGMDEDKQIGYYMFDNGLGPSDVQALYDGPHGSYVDVEQYGRDLRLGGDVTVAGNGLIFNNDDMPSTDTYSREEIDQWIHDNA